MKKCKFAFLMAFAIVTGCVYHPVYLPPWVPSDSDPSDSDASGGDNTVSGGADSKLQDGGFVGGDTMFSDGDLGGDLLPDGAPSGDEAMGDSVPPSDVDGGDDFSGGDAWFPLEITVTLPNVTYEALPDNVQHTAYHVTLESNKDTLIDGLDFSFDFRQSPGGPIAGVDNAEVWLYRGTVQAISQQGTGEVTTTWSNVHMDTAFLAPAPLLAGSPQDYLIKVRATGVQPGYVLTTALVMIHLNDGSSISVTGKEITLPEF